MKLTNPENGLGLFKMVELVTQAEPYICFFNHRGNNPISFEPISFRVKAGKQVKLPTQLLFGSGAKLPVTAHQKGRTIVIEAFTLGYVESDRYRCSQQQLMASVEFEVTDLETQVTQMVPVFLYFIERSKYYHRKKVRPDSYARVASRLKLYFKDFEDSVEPNSQEQSQVSENGEESEISEELSEDQPLQLLEERNEFLEKVLTGIAIRALRGEGDHTLERVIEPSPVYPGYLVFENRQYRQPLIFRSSVKLDPISYAVVTFSREEVYLCPLVQVADKEYRVEFPINVPRGKDFVVMIAEYTMLKHRSEVKVVTSTTYHVALDELRAAEKRKAEDLEQQNQVMQGLAGLVKRRKTDPNFNVDEVQKAIEALAKALRGPGS